MFSWRVPSNDLHFGFLHLAHPAHMLQYGLCGPPRRTHGERTMSAQIKFGTSGWRAIVADEFTVANVKRAVTGIARYVAGTGTPDPKLVVGRDPRYMGETFVAIAATILENYWITRLVISDPAPTPA